MATFVGMEPEAGKTVSQPASKVTNTNSTFRRLSQRVLLPLALVVTSLAMNAAPAHASGWQPGGDGDSRFKCGATKTLQTANGFLQFQACAIVYHDAKNRTTYHQGLLSAYYRSTRDPVRSDSFVGETTFALDGRTTDTVNCGAATFKHPSKKWCFTPTRATIGNGHSVQATGTITRGGQRHSVSSPLVGF